MTTASHRGKTMMTTRMNDDDDDDDDDDDEDGNGDDDDDDDDDDDTIITMLIGNVISRGSRVVIAENAESVDVSVIPVAVG